MAEVLIYGDDFPFHEILTNNDREEGERDVIITRSVQEMKRRVTLEDLALILIDLEGREDQGIELACFIRQLPRQYFTPILFLSVNNELEDKAFHEIHCYDYFVKPLSMSEITKIVFLCLQRMEACRRNEPIVFPVGRDRYPVCPDDIVYLESRNRTMVVHTINDELPVPSENLTDFVGKHGGCFLRIHRAIVVNRNRIFCFDKKHNTVEMAETGEILSVGRTYINSIRKLFDESADNVYNE